ncbi:MAG: hypothetical protein WC819_01930 [Parcubacteria group bacterium]|jgi:spermidine synthase
MEKMKTKGENENIQSITLPIFETGENMTIGVKEIFYDKKSEFQDIMVIDTKEFGRCLIINKCMQTAESDHHLYDKEILTLLRPEDRSLAILGGGDGYVAQEALTQNPQLQIDLAELDPEIIYCAKEFLEQKVFDDPRLHLHIGDGLVYMENAVKEGKELYDGLVCDFTGEPITEEEKAEFTEFYRKVIALTHKVVKTGGWVAFQAGDTDVDRDKYVDAALLLQGIFEEYFTDVTRSDIMIPSYGERDSFLFGIKK